MKINFRKALKLNRRFARKLLVVVVVVKTALANGEGLEFVATNSPADQFKQFIANPLPINDIFVEIVQTNQASAFYHAKWQTNAVFIGCQEGVNKLELKNATNLVSYSSIFSRYDNIYWQKIGGDYYCWTNRNLPRQATNSITFGHNNFLHWVVNQALNGGVDELPVGTIRWTGDEFSCSNAETGNWYKGMLKRDTVGRAASLNIRSGELINPKYGVFNLDYVYYYDAILVLPFFPSRIETTICLNNNVLAKRTIIIHSIDVADAAMPIEAFSLQSLLFTTNINTVITISNNMLVTMPTRPNSGRVVGIAQDGIAERLVKKPHYREVYFIIASLLLLIPVLITFGSRKQKQ